MSLIRRIRDLRPAKAKSLSIHAVFTASLYDAPCQTRLGASVYLEVMKKAILAITLLLGVSFTGFAQETQEPLEIPEIELPEFIEEKDPLEEEAEVKEERPDYSHLPPKAEKRARLDDLFEKLKTKEEAEDGNLIAEEIWAIWLDSGSASVDVLLRRGTAAGKQGDRKLARRMYDHVTTIMPDYAEGWARSGRLAYEQQDYNRAVVELTQALILEPRHFYALWSMGNILESLGRQDEALKVYREAFELYPSMPQIKQRKEALEATLEGAIL